MNNIWTTELTNTCNCEATHCPNCDELVDAVGELHDSMECWNCSHDFDGTKVTAVEEDYDCSGLCWDDMVEEADALWQEFQDIAPADQNFYRVNGSNMGWRHRNGSMIVDMETVKPWEVISVDSEWTQRWTLDRDAKTLTVVQTHHDSMGESYEFIPLTAAEVDKLFENDH